MNIQNQGLKARWDGIAYNQCPYTMSEITKVALWYEGWQYGQMLDKLVDCIVS